MVFSPKSVAVGNPNCDYLTREADGEYSLKEYQEPLTGRYSDSVKELFPQNLHDRVFNAHDDYPTLAQAQEDQAMGYLESIGRTAEVRIEHVEKELHR